MKLSTQEANKVLERLEFKRRLAEMDLVVAIARDWATGQVLMQAYMDREAVLATLTTGKVTYWSTSRRRLWVKGEESGSTQRLSGLRIDCDGDSILLDVEQTGPACHKGYASCYDAYERLGVQELKEELVRITKRDALLFGDFTLTSGRKSTYYLNIKKIITRPQGLSLVSKLIQGLYTKDVDMVAGPELGAVPIVTSVAMRSNLPYAMIRKGERSHGTQQRVEGEMGKGNRVLLIDDVATSGGSLVGCVETIQATGAKVLRVTCVVDRKEGASELLRSKCGIELMPLLTIDDLGIRP